MDSTDNSESSDSISQGVFDDIANITETTDGSSVPGATSTEISLPLNIQEFSKRGVSQVSGSADFLAVLQRLSVPGPLDLTHALSEAMSIGRGGQFTVYTGSVLQPGSPAWSHFPVAIKKTRLPVGPDRRFDLASTESLRFMGDMYLEIVALMEPRLKSHRNIVELIGWSTENSIESTPLLIMELALGSLDTFLTSHDKLSWDVKQVLCLDMGRGLDALHEAGVIHGDFKPANVLVFETSNPETSGVPFIAKLADFGYAVVAPGDSENSKIKIHGLTRLWCAPEISCRAALTALELTVADNYSYGLTIWSTFFHLGRPPWLRANDTSTWATDIADKGQGLRPELALLIDAALSSLLVEHSSLRPYKVANLLRDASENYKVWTQQYETTNSTSTSKSTSIKKAEASANACIHNNGISWSNLILPVISRYLLEGLEASFVKYGDVMTATETFTMFLLASYKAVSYCVTENSLFIRLLIKSAQLGEVAAQAIVFRVFQFAGISWPKSLSNTSPMDWLCKGVLNGCRIAHADLFELDQGLARKNLEQFRRLGGYQQHLSSEEQRSAYRYFREDLSRPCIVERISNLHLLDHTCSWEESFGSKACSQGGHTPHKTRYGWRRLLFMACQAGDTDAVKILCSKTASAEFTMSPGISVLHWLFVFASEDIDEVSKILFEAGADPNKMTMEALPDYNYPFCWPQGSPLHWAVTAGNVPAVTALLQLGADPFLRNGTDPYTYDEVVRRLDHPGEFAESDYA